MQRKTKLRQKKLVYVFQSIDFYRGLSALFLVDYSPNAFYTYILIYFTSTD